MSGLAVVDARPSEQCSTRQNTEHQQWNEDGGYQNFDHGIIRSGLSVPPA
jgi:hypothetical protein